jgi:hypothetical protein
MDIGFYVWLYGTNTKITCDANSEVDTAALPAVTENDWAKCYVLTVHPHESELEEAEDRHGIMVDSVTQKQEYELKFYPFAFPDEMANLEKVYSVFRKRNKYLCLDGADQAEGDKYPHRIHAAGKAIQVVCTGRDYEDDDENSAKNLTLKLRKKKPIVPGV